MTAPGTAGTASPAHGAADGPPGRRSTGASARGLSSREAARRLVHYGPNELTRRGGSHWPRELARQLTHPLALLLWLAAALAYWTGGAALAAAIVVVVLLNAGFSLLQEHHAERAVEALRDYLPPHALVLRDGHRRRIEVTALVPGDVLFVAEGDRISADARITDGAVEVDMSALTGESAPVWRTAGPGSADGEALRDPHLLFSGTACTGGEATAVVRATGMHTELGRIAALTERVGRDLSPLEAQVKRVAWIIAVVAVAAGAAFLPLGLLIAGLSPYDAGNFAIGMLVANVPEGLLPTITLALAVGVRGLAREGAVVKRLSAVETLGSTSVICTDKTGTLTENRMRVTAAVPAGESAAATRDLLVAAAACTTADHGENTGDPTELALLAAAADAGVGVPADMRAEHRRAVFHFDPALRLMSTVDEDGGGLWAHTKGAPEEVLVRCTTLVSPDGGEAPLDEAGRVLAMRAVEEQAGRGMRLLGVARRRLADVPARREQAETSLCWLGFVAMFDPPRAGVADAAAQCRTAGIRIIVVTGDHGRTAAEIARRTGIATGEPRIVTGAELAAMTEEELDRLLADTDEVVFARTSPEAKLRIADALRESGRVVAMTGDGVNDAPALRRADIGVAMGASGTDVAREASTMVLTDDNFATVVAAVRTGRQVYDNVRKFILYIFAHLTPEAVPFLVFALSGGAVPLPLTVMQILAIDLGTETLPALALGRENAEPGLMRRRPRDRRGGVVDLGLVLRAWLLLGIPSALCVLAAYLGALRSNGWTPGASVDAGTPLHLGYVQATTMAFLAIVACQVGTAFAARTEHASLASIGVWSNRALLRGIAFELAFAATVVYVPALRPVFHTAPPSPAMLLWLLPMPFLVWGVDEWYRARRRRANPPRAVAGPTSLLQ